MGRRYFAGADSGLPLSTTYVPINVASLHQWLARPRSPLRAANHGISWRPSSSGADLRSGSNRLQLGDLRHSHGPASLM